MHHVLISTLFCYCINIYLSLCKNKTTYCILNSIFVGYSIEEKLMVS